MVCKPPVVAGVSLMIYPPITCDMDSYHSEKSARIFVECVLPTLIQC